MLLPERQFQCLHHADEQRSQFAIFCLLNQAEVSIFKNFSLENVYTSREIYMKGEILLSLPSINFQVLRKC